MPRVNHNVGHSNASNHVQQTNLLTRIEENTKNINVNVGDVEINVQDVEALLTTTNTKLAGGLPSALTGSGHLSISIDEIGNTGSEKLAVNLDTQISQHFPTALSGSGRLKVESHITDHSKESKQDTAIGHLSTVAGAVIGTEMQVDVITMPTVAVTLAGGSTEAKQDDGITHLATIAGDTTSIDGKITACNTGAVVVSSSALPSGAATQSTLNDAEVHLGSIDGKITLCNTGSVIISASALPSGAATQSTLNDAEVHLGSIDGKITACNTGAVVVSSSALPSDAATESTLSSLLSSSQIISEDFTACDTGAVVISSSALPSGAATESSLAAINGKITACNTGAVVVSSSALPSGAATQSTLNDAEVHLGSIDGKITACNTGAVVVSGSALPSGAATQSTLNDAEVHLGNIETSVQLIDDVVGTDGTTGPGKCISIGGTESGGNIQELLVDSAGHLQIDVLSAPSTAVTNTTLTNLNNCIDSNELQVDIVASLPTGSNAIGKLSANSGVDIGDVDVTSLPLTFNSGNKDATCQRVVVATDDVNLSAIKSSLTTIEGTVGLSKVNVNLSSDAVGLSTSALQGTLNTKIDTIDSVLDNSLLKQTLATTSELKTLLSGVTVNAGAQSSQFDTENYDKARFFGETTASVGTDIILMGAATDGGQAYVLGENLRSETIGGVHYVYGPVVENLPKYIRIINKSGSTNYVFTKLFMQLSGGRLAV